MWPHCSMDGCCEGLNGSRSEVIFTDGELSQGGQVHQAAYECGKPDIANVVTV